VRIASVAHHLPPRVETAAELAPRIGRSERWIIERTGVAERRIAEEPVDAMAARAVRALGVDGADLLLYAAATPHRLIPDTAPFVLAQLGWTGTPAWSVHATCLSFLAALRMANADIACGQSRRVVIVSAERGSMARDFREPESAALLGDGAAAVLLEATGESSILASRWESYPEARELATYRGMGADFYTVDAWFHMNGPRLYRLVRQIARPFLDALFAAANVRPDEIACVIPHQASMPGVHAWELYGFPRERVVDILGVAGNCVAASIPMALSFAVADGRLKRGDLALLVGSGAGLSIAGTILRY
jgi:3-oxoacyl-[acyl-carrier-protein] synthase-3